jgi:predicted PurR-regulated permease PerM
MLVLPLCNRLEGWGLNRALSIFLCILVILGMVAGILSLFSVQVVSFSEDVPKVKTQLQEVRYKAQTWIETQFKIPPQKQESFLEENTASSAKDAGKLATRILSGAIGGFTTFLLILVYIFFFLFYREKYEVFFMKIRGDNHAQEVKVVLDKIAKVAVKYIGGKFVAILILAVLNSAGLLIIGVKYAILLGCLTALFTFIPYVGTIVGGVFAAGTAMVTKSPGAALAVIAMMGLIQLIDDYFIEPYIVGGQVNLSPLAIIVILVIGGLLWGVAGMILFIPMLGIAKVIFDHVPSLHPYGYLIGDDKKEGDNSLSKKLKSWFKGKQAA